MDEVLEFVHRRFSKDCDWMNGNCYWFAQILCERFPHLTIAYKHIAGHFVAFDFPNFYYDYEGIHEADEDEYDIPEEFDRICLIDPLLAKRLYRDCKF